MKSIRKLLLIGAGLFVALNPLHAQNTSTVQPATSDSIVQLTADAQGLPLVSPEAVPNAGTFWVVTPGLDASSLAPYPCPPRNQTLPVYAITDSQFLVDATGGRVMSSASQPVTSATLNAAMETLAVSVVDLISQVQDAQLAQDFGFASAAAGLRSLNTMQANSLSPGDGGDDSFRDGDR